MIDWTPEPIWFSIGPLHVYWYGVMYAVGLAAVYWVVHREVVRRGLDAGLLVNGMIIVAVAALIGGRIYHVIDQWALYKDNLVLIVLPPYTGLGAYGGIVTGFIAGVAYAVYKKQPLAPWADSAVIGVLTMQAIGRWGNFFNQELYGPPTTLPWGIAIDCEHRASTWACPPVGTTPADAHFQPLFLYESISGAIGAIVLSWVGRHVRWVRDGDLVLLFFVWYGTTRFLLEPLRTNNWLFFGIPTASVLSGLAVLGALAILAWRHRPGTAAGARRTRAAALPLDDDAGAGPMFAADPSRPAAVPSAEDDPALPAAGRPGAGEG
ncbi:MAG: prolipoprotein diacylglyceryl transferase [Chloroflexi bacterium]|nr:prolipoprotein diacylglyceryl transferase [Chloroflexota bacterium]